MKLIHTIPLHLVRETLANISLEFSCFVLVESAGYLKIYQEVN